LSCADPAVFRVLAAGPFDPRQVSVQWQNRPLRLPVEMEREIDDLWQELRTDHCYNGKLARLDFWQAQDGALQLRLSSSDYRTLLYSNRNVQRIAQVWGESFYSRALGISAVVVSQDRQILLMQRSETVGEYPNCFDVFGGHIDAPADESAPWVFAAMEQELEEELALSHAEYSLQCLGLGESIPNRKPELVFSAKCERSGEEIIRLASQAKDAREYVSIFAVADEEMALAHFLRENKQQLSPSAYGSLCLYADQCF